LKFLPSRKIERERGRESTGWLKEDPRERERRWGGREERGWLNAWPNERWRREEGREERGWLNFAPNVRWVMLEGRGGTGELKRGAKERCVRRGRGGRGSILSCALQIEMMEEGRATLREKLMGR
jgi:hypothetical protein